MLNVFLIFFSLRVQKFHSPEKNFFVQLNILQHSRTRRYREFTKNAQVYEAENQALLNIVIQYMLQRVGHELDYRLDICSVTGSAHIGNL